MCNVTKKGKRHGLKTPGADTVIVKNNYGCLKSL